MPYDNPSMKEGPPPKPKSSLASWLAIFFILLLIVWLASMLPDYSTARRSDIEALRQDIRSLRDDIARMRGGTP